MHIGLLLLELGINDYDLNRKNYFHTNFELRTAKWTFLACRVNEITNLINTTDYILPLLFFQILTAYTYLNLNSVCHTLFTFTFTLSITVLLGEWLI